MTDLRLISGVEKRRVVRGDPYVCGCSTGGTRAVMTSREERRAQNEAIFRSGNEAIKKNVGNSKPILQLICECGTAECLDTIEVTPAEFEAVRSHPARFVLALGHQDETELVVDEFDRFSVVEKTGTGRSVVE